MTPSYLNSATKTVLLLLIVTVCGLSVYQTVVTGQIPETFFNALMAVIGYYFGKKEITPEGK